MKWDTRSIAYGSSESFDIAQNAPLHLSEEKQPYTTMRNYNPKAPKEYWALRAPCVRVLGFWGSVEAFRRVGFRVECLR